jgi:hypothetical protein
MFDDEPTQGTLTPLAFYRTLLAYYYARGQSTAGANEKIFARHPGLGEAVTAEMAEGQRRGEFPQSTVHKQRGTR